MKTVASRKAAARAKRAYRLRQLGCAFSRVIVDGQVLAMLIEAGKLQPKERHTDAEIEEAATSFLFDLAGKKNLSRVRTIMADRWHSQSATRS